MNPKNIRTTSKEFEDRLDMGAFWEGWVSAVLARCGLHTIQHPMVNGGTRDHSVSYDLDVCAADPLLFGVSPLISEHSDVITGLSKRARPTARGALCPIRASRVSRTSTATEVKSSALTFTKPQDYPMPTALVCAQDSWMKKWPGKETVQRDFLLVSRVTGHIVWIPVGTKVQLNHPVTDRNRDYSYKCAVVNREQLQPFRKFVDMVKRV